MKRIFILIFILFLSGCAQSNYPKIETLNSNEIQTKEMIKIPEAPGLLVFNDDVVLVDYSNTQDGYIMVKTLKDDHKRLKIRISANDQEYTYDINKDNYYISYPLSMGDGTYNIKVFENIEGTSYATLYSFNIEVNIKDEFSPYLYPNIIVDYDLQTRTVDKSFELCEGLTSKIDKVYNVYKWITKNIDYDWDKVEDIQGKYVLPILDETLDLKKGICFDYAAMMTCMLRVQNIPTKVVTGYVEEGYHAWVEVYIEDIGWINPDIYFDSENWTMIDPTFDAMGGGEYKGAYNSTNKY